MGIFNRQLLSRQDLIYGFAISALPIHLWSIFVLLHEAPGWILRLSLWELIGAVAYTQAFALFESILLVLFLAALSLLIPAKLYRHKFIAQSTSFLLITTIWLILFRLFEDKIDAWGTAPLILLVLVYFVSLGIFTFLVLRSARFEKALIAFVQRASVLVFIYVMVDVISIFIIVFRNI